MSDLVENGRREGSWRLQSDESHEEFFELCALSTTDQLGASERRRLDEHLRECFRCSDMLAQYHAVLKLGIPLAVVGEEGKAWSETNWSIDEAEVELFARLDHETQPAQTAGSQNTAEESARSESGSEQILRRPRGALVDTLWRQLWWHYAAGVVLALALGASLYRGGIGRGEKIGESASPAQPAAVRFPGKFNQNKPAATADASSAVGRAEAATVSGLRAQLESKKDEVALLEDEKAHLKQRLVAIQNERDQLARNADQQGRRLEAREADLAAARQQLAATQSQNFLNEARLAAIEKQIEDLKGNAGRKDQEIAREQELLEHDRDIRELMGSRKLYIVEVYDVAKNGRTQRPFGRVFYTQGKSLIFYAYDLDQQPGIREASSFQAWGRTGQDPTHAVNLGIFYSDSAANNRWVLKSDDPKTLADINAVFVTVEPQGGSNHPIGKPLLFAYLRIEPNHP